MLAKTKIISNCLVRLFQLGSVIAVFHERPEEAPESTQENPKYTGKLLVEPPRYKNYLPLFNEQWRMKANWLMEHIKFRLNQMVSLPLQLV
jgi:hypothetical protein